LAVLVVGLWTGRAHFREVFRAAFPRTITPPRQQRAGRDAPPLPTEAQAYRWAFFGALGGMVFLLAFVVRAGMSLGVALAFFGLYFAIVVMITRIRAELGFPVHDLAWAGPHHTLVAVAGTPALGARNLTMFALLYWLVRRFTSHPMPHQLEGFKLAERTGTAPQSVVVAVLLAAVVGILGGWWLYLDRYYAVGAESAHWNGWTVWLGREAFNTLDNWLKVPTEAEPGATAALGFGFGFALILSALRLRLPHFPFHPLAYAVAPSWGMANLWSCVFLAWLAKAFLLRYAGLKGYRRAGPFFLGLILGEFVCGAAWTLVGLGLHLPSYDFWP
jgi:hypothetical protein